MAIPSATFLPIRRPVVIIVFRKSPDHHSCFHDSIFRKIFQKKIRDSVPDFFIERKLPPRQIVLKPAKRIRAGSVSLIPGFSILPELLKRWFVLIEHMAGRIIGEGQIVLHIAVQEQMAVGPFRGKEGRRLVIVAADHPNLHHRVFGHTVMDDLLLAEDGVFILW